MITVTPLDFIGQNDRGITYAFNNMRTGQFLMAYRVAGSVNGGHFHSGKHEYKQPEHIILVQGEAMLYWKLEDEQAGSIHVKAPTSVQIPQNVWHQLVAITDFVMLELNGIEAGKEDTFPEFGSMVTSIY